MPIQQTMFQRMVMVRAGAIFEAANTKAARVQQAGQGCGREMPEVMRQGEVIPILSEMARLIACEVRQCDQDQAAGPKDAASLVQFGARIGEMLERIPERNDVESRRRQTGHGERNIRTRSDPARAPPADTGVAWARRHSDPSGWGPRRAGKIPIRIRRRGWRLNRESDGGTRCDGADRGESNRDRRRG